MLNLLNDFKEKNIEKLLDLKLIQKFFINSLCNSKIRDMNLMKNLYSQLEEKDIREFAKKEGCVSIVYSSLEEILGDSNVPVFWKKEREKTKKRIELYMERLDHIAEILFEQNISILALKNTGIARGIHKDLSECPMGDIDILVDPDQLELAHHIMLRNGYHFNDRSPFKINQFDKAFEHGGTEYTCTLIDGSTLWVELQWRSIAGRRIPIEQEPTFKELLKNSIQINNSKVRLLSPEDNLLQVCLHTAKHSFVRSPGFRLHTDVERILQNYNIDWNLFLEKVEKLRVKTPVYIALILPCKLFNLNVPISVLKKLNYFPIKHRIILIWLREVGLFGPEEKKWSKIGFIVFNILLFDNFKDLFRSAFPKRKTMNLKYRGLNKSQLFKTYIARIFSLLFKRNNNI